MSRIPHEYSFALAVMEAERQGFTREAMLESRLGSAVLAVAEAAPVPDSWLEYTGLYNPVPFSQEIAHTACLTAQGYAQTQIAGRQLISLRQVRINLAAARSQLNVGTTDALMRRATELGIIEAPSALHPHSQLELEPILSLSVASRGWTIPRLMERFNWSEKVAKAPRRRAHLAFHMHTVTAAIPRAIWADVLLPDHKLIAVWRDKLPRDDAGV